MKGITEQMLAFALDEGVLTALDRAESLQLALTDIAEIGDTEEGRQTCKLLANLNRAIEVIALWRAIEEQMGTIDTASAEVRERYFNTWIKVLNQGEF